MTVIPKPGKDPTQVTTYRPISLLNDDIKCYAKIIANRLLPLIPSIISLDQVGFIPGREASDNTIKTLNIHHWLTAHAKPCFLLTLDVEKAFDRVAWNYLHASLESLGLPPMMLAFNSPLSSLIYILTLEPLLRCIRANPYIKGIQINGREFKTATLANDVLLYLSEPLISLAVLMKDFEHFGVLSHLKINYAKLHALNITLPQELVTRCKASLPFAF